jgi:hypothetical protein
MARPWTGAIHLASPGDLPQLPLALAEAAYRDQLAGSVVAWGTDQRTATVAAALAALRAQSAPAHPASAPSGALAGTVAAAGWTQDRWLLDGALRLLADLAVPGPDLPRQDDLPLDLRLLFRVLADHELVVVEPSLLRVPGFAAPLVQIRDGGTGAVLARGWGVDEEYALRAALGCALARAQTHRIRGTDLVPDGVDTTLAVTADQAVVDRLLLDARRLLPLAGWRRSDPVLGLHQIWFGMVGQRIVAGTPEAGDGRP